VHALDYLLKPFDDERFQGALERARQHTRRFKEGDFTQKIRALLRALEGLKAPEPDKGTYLDRLAVKSGGRVQFFRIEEVDWIEAAGDYMCLHIGKKPHYVREKMGALEERLDPRRFVRIHRSTIVNIDRIRELRGHDSGGYVVLLQDGTELKLSRSYQTQVFGLLGEVS
jgi:two-component system LytT family response regulator